MRLSDKPHWAVAGGVLAVVAMLIAPVNAQNNSDKIDKRKAEKSYTVTLEANRQSLTCFPSTSVEYQQSNTMAQVIGVIVVDDCAAASGDYRVSLVIRDDDGNSETLQFEESWSRDDASPIVIENEYPIGDDVDLLRARVRSKRCQCAEAGGEPSNER